jgi:hypothetical protein
MANRTTLSDALSDDEDVQPEDEASEQASEKVAKGIPPVKLTLEFERDLHTKLKTFALLKADGASLASLMRAAAVLLERDTRFGNAVIKEAKKQKGRR